MKAVKKFKLAIKFRQHKISISQFCDFSALKCLDFGIESILGPKFQGDLEISEIKFDQYY